MRRRACTVAHQSILIISRSRHLPQHKSSLAILRHRFNVTAKTDDSCSLIAHYEHTQQLIAPRTSTEKQSSLACTNFFIGFDLQLQSRRDNSPLEWINNNKKALFVHRKALHKIHGGICRRCLAGKILQQYQRKLLNNICNWSDYSIEAIKQ